MLAVGTFDAGLLHLSTPDFSTGEVLYKYNNVWAKLSDACVMLMCVNFVVLCTVKRDNVIFALTRHGGHLGYFEGGIVLPNSVTWLDRIIVEFSMALLHCSISDPQQQPAYQMCRSMSESCADDD